MARKCIVLLAIGLLFPALASAQPAAEDVVTVKVTGQGLNHEAALNDALRKAIEQGGKVYLYSKSKTENYELIKDTIIAQASGLIKDYKIIKKGKDPIGGYAVTITARVDRKIIDATWGQVEVLLRQIGRPKILVSFVERIYDNTLPAPQRERVDADSLLANRIEKLLLDKGFALVDKSQINNINQAKLAEAMAKKEPDLKAIAKLAGEFGAQMFIVGFSRASGPQITNTYGVTLHMWETDVTLKAYWSETAAMLFADSKVGDRSGSRVVGPPGAKKAILKAGDILAQRCLHAILQKWSKMAAGGGGIVLEIKDLSLKQVLAIQNTLRDTKGVKEVRREWQKPNVKFEIITTDTAEIFMEKLVEMTWPDFVLDVQDQKFKTITAKIEKK